MRVLGLLLMFPFLVQAQMYKCVDERGKVFYTDKPLTGCKESAIKGNPPLSGAVRPRQENLGAAEADFRRRQLERERKEASEAKEREALEQRCARLRQERALLGGGRRIVRIDAKGERVYMDDAVRDQRLAQVDEQLRGCP